MIESIPPNTSIAPGLGREVLLVDDDPIQTRLVRTLLEQSGFVVASADGVPRALEILTSSKPSAVVSDVLMDGADGFALARRIRETETLADLQVILLSSYFTETTDQVLARECGANALVVRTPGLEAGIRALVESLGSASAPMVDSPPSGEHYVHRVEHHLMRTQRERSAVESALEASERRYRSLVENMPDVIWSTTTSRVLTFISANVERTLGFSAAELLTGEAGPTRIHPEDLPRFRAAFDALVARRTPVLDAEYRWRHRDGRWLWLRCRGRLSVSPDGTEGVDGIFSDVTERKLLEEELYHAQKVEAIGQLTAGIAHSINNILASLLGNAEYLVTRLPEGDDRDAARDIVSSTKQGVAFAGQLSAFSRREFASPTNIDLNHAVRTVQAMLPGLIGARIALSVETAEDLGLVCATANQVEQVLVNLASNARDAMPNGGALAIETRNVEIEEPTAAAEGVLPGRYVMISMRDTGPGIDSATLPRLFEPFFTTKAGCQGAGLGLSISHGILRRFGGFLVAEGGHGSGATFKAFFPIVGEEPSDEAAAGAGGGTRPQVDGGSGSRDIRARGRSSSAPRFAG